MHYALSLPVPPQTSAGWPPTCSFVTVNQALRYLAGSILGSFVVSFFSSWESVVAGWV
jgi:hypothetical protein